MVWNENEIFKCPNCGNFLLKKVIASAITFGSTLYSDGKNISSGLEDLPPNLTKCERCDTIFWLSDLKSIGKTHCSDPKWRNAEYAKFLNIKDLFRALAMVESQKEKTIRTWIWWAFNDRVRYGGEEMFIEADDKDLWEQNCKALLNLFDTDNWSDTFLKAELYRNLGEFEKCIELIDSIDMSDKENEESQWINYLKDQMKNKINNKERLVFKAAGR